MKKCWIRVQNPTISAIVQQFLFEAGYGWYGGVRKSLGYCTRTALFVGYSFSSKMGLTQSTYDYALNSYGKDLHFDAATEFGAFVDYITKPEVAPIKNVTKEHDGIVREDKSGIDVGCQFVSAEKIRECYKAIS